MLALILVAAIGGDVLIPAASIVVALIAAGSAEMSRRAAAKASHLNTTEEIERAAYQRAEQLLDRQFKRQEEEIEGLHADVERLQTRVRRLENQHAEDQRSIAQRDDQIRTYARLLADRGTELS